MRGTIKSTLSCNPIYFKRNRIISNQAQIILATVKAGDACKSINPYASLSSADLKYQHKTTSLFENHTNYVRYSLTVQSNKIFFATLVWIWKNK